MDLFTVSQNSSSDQPLAAQSRPGQWSEFLGQDKYASANSQIFSWIKKTGRLPNIIIWGPPGTGKTTYALLLAKEVKVNFIHTNAVDTGAKELRAIGDKAGQDRKILQEKTVLFIDEIHRLNKSQQDVLLPFTESGDVSLIGATTENPSYELNAALISRCRILKFDLLSETQLEKIVLNSCQKKNIQILNLISENALKQIIKAAHGDARRVLNIIDLVIQSHDGEKVLELSDLESMHIISPLPYDKNGEEHYNVISAFIKSVRGSDANAAVYYLARMLEAGEDPVFIARRLVILASEDIGLADPQGLVLATSALQAVELIGMPEARISLSHVTMYLAKAPKSNLAYTTIDNAINYVRKTGALSVPLHLRSSKTALSQSFGYGKDYIYSHADPENKAKQTYLPKEALNEDFSK
jgi:putative ATPase